PSPCARSMASGKSASRSDAAGRRRAPALLLPVVIAIGLAAALPAARAPDVPAAPAVQAAPGDIVLRRGDGFWSNFFARLNRRDRRFSHAGVVVREHGALRVVHAEADDSGANGRVRLDDYAAFTADGTGYVVLRLADREAAARLAEAASSMHAAALPFDLDFDLADPAAVYCSELVWRALSLALRRDPLPDKPVVAGRPV